jgi:hypothetical protein
MEGGDGRDVQTGVQLPWSRQNDLACDELDRHVLLATVEPAGRDDDGRPTSAFACERKHRASAAGCCFRATESAGSGVSDMSGSSNRTIPPRSPWPFGLSVWNGA